jgi:hypothetical protein
MERRPQQMLSLKLPGQPVVLGVATEVREHADGTVDVVIDLETPVRAAERILEMTIAPEVAMSREPEPEPPGPGLPPFPSPEPPGPPTGPKPWPHPNPPSGAV